MADDRTSPSSTFISLGEGGSSQPPRPGGPRRGVIAGIASLACVALIVVSLGFVHPGPDGGWSIAWLMQTTAAEQADAGSAEAAEEAGSGSAEAEASEAAQGAAREDDAGDGSSSRGGDAVQAVGEEAPSIGSHGESGTGGDDPGAVGGSGGAGTSSGNSSNASGATSDKPSTVTVRVSVDSSAVGSPVSASGRYTFNAGATAYDALCALGLSVDAQSSYLGIYVRAIGGLAEKEHGSTSGWIYYVNGSMSDTSCGNYRLSDGDVVEWVYSPSE